MCPHILDTQLYTIHIEKERDKKRKGEFNMHTHKDTTAIDFVFDEIGAECLEQYSTVRAFCIYRQFTLTHDLLSLHQSRSLDFELQSRTYPNRFRASE